MSVIETQPVPPATVRTYIERGMSFDVSREAFDEALLQAIRWRKIMFIGLMSDGTSKVSASQEYLFQKGAIACALVVPGDASL